MDKISFVYIWNFWHKKGVQNLFVLGDFVCRGSLVRGNLNVRGETNVFVGQQII
jgi:hypothetical protein